MSAASRTPGFFTHRSRRLWHLPFVLALLLPVAIIAAACKEDGDGDGAVAGVQAPAGDGEGSVADLVARASQSVVRVGVNCQDERARNCQGTGSGWVLDDRGHIVTNNHVVTLGGSQQAGRITISTFEGEQLEAEIVGRDPRTDLAVLKIDEGKLKPLPLGDLEETRIGEFAIAIGYALDLGNSPSVTTGVVSAKERAINEPETSILGTIQTDAPINPGNSGGPLLNGRGEVIGVNTAGIQGAQGIGFAVGVDTVKVVTAELLENGSIERGFIGIAFEDVTAAEAEELDLPGEGGVRILEVVQGSPADQAGLEVGDIITKAGSRDVRASSDVSLAIVGKGAGETLTLEYVRDGDRESADVKLGQPAQASR